MFDIAVSGELAVAIYSGSYGYSAPNASGYKGVPPAIRSGASIHAAVAALGERNDAFHANGVPPDFPYPYW